MDAVTAIRELQKMKQKRLRWWKISRIVTWVFAIITSAIVLGEIIVIIHYVVAQPKNWVSNSFLSGVGLTINALILFISIIPSFKKDREIAEKSIKEINETLALYTLQMPTVPEGERISLN